MGQVQLSRYQKEVVSKMDNGLFLWKNEGNNFRAWLGDESGKFVERVRIPTATFLFNNKVIEFVDGDYPIRLYKYQLKNK